jgi:hypothetical protein
MCEGGLTGADPFTFTVIDDTTFSLSFKQSYGGFPLHLAIVGWKGYTELLKPPTTKAVPHRLRRGMSRLLWGLLRVHAAVRLGDGL